jgi:hypothetical protein
MIHRVSQGPTRPLDKWWEVSAPKAQLTGEALPGERGGPGRGHPRPRLTKIAKLLD